MSAYLKLFFLGTSLGIQFFAIALYLIYRINGNELSFNFIQLIFYISILTGWILSIKLFPRKPISGKVNDYLWLLIFTPLAYAVLTVPAIQQSYHGPFHHAYVIQIIKSGLPLINVNFPGEAVVTYWSFHAFIAVLSRLTDLASPQINGILNLFFLISCYLLLLEILRKLNVRISRVSTFLIVSFILFSGNLLAFIPLLFAKISEGFSLGVNHYDPLFILERMLFASNHSIKQTASLYAKFFNFSGFPIGLTCFLTGLYFLIVHLQKNKYLFFIATSVTACILLHSTIGFYSAVVLIGSTLIFKIKDGSIRYWIGSNSQNWKGKLFSAISFLPSLFILLLGLEWLSYGSRNFGSSNASFNLFLTDNWISVLTFSGVQIGILMYSIVKHKSNIHYLIIPFTISLVLALFMDIKIVNQYKFILITGMLASMAIIPFLLKLKEQRNQVFNLLMLLPILNMGIVSYAYLKSSWVNKKVAFDGIHYQAEGAHLWLRDNAELNTLIISPVNVYSYSVLKETEVPVYYVEEKVFKDNKKTTLRTERIKSIYSNTADQSNSAIFDSIKNETGNESLYLILTKAWHGDPEIEYMQMIYEDDINKIYKY